MGTAHGLGGMISRGTGPGGGGRALSIGGLNTRPGGRGPGGHGDLELEGGGTISIPLLTAVSLGAVVTNLFDEEHYQAFGGDQRPTSELLRWLAAAGPLPRTAQAPPRGSRNAIHMPGGDSERGGAW